MGDKNDHEDASRETFGRTVDGRLGLDGQTTLWACIK